MIGTPPINRDFGGCAVPANYRYRPLEAAPATLDAAPARRIRRMLSTPVGRKDNGAASHRVSPLLRHGTTRRFNFPSEDESRADWLELRHLQADLDERSKQFHARQYAVDAVSGAADQGSSGKQLTPASARRRSSVEGTPIRTPGRSSLLVPAPGREQHERAAPLGRDFWIELKGAVYGVSYIETQLYVDEQQRFILADTVNDVIEFQSSDTGGHQAKTLLERLNSVSFFAANVGVFRITAPYFRVRLPVRQARELFETERSFADFIKRNPTTRLKDFEEIEAALVLWYNVDAQLDEFRDRCALHIQWCTDGYRKVAPVILPDGSQFVIPGSRPNSLRFAQKWAPRLNFLLYEYLAHTSRRRAVGLPSLAGKYGSAMMLLIRLVYNLATKDSEFMGEKHIGDLIQLAKELLTMNCANASGRWHAHMRELERSDYEELLSQLFERYFDIIRSPGWSFRPEVRVTSWIQSDIQTQVARRNETLKSEWHFLTELLPKLQAIIPDAEKHFVVGMMTLSQALLRDLRILCSTDDVGASQVFDDVVRSNVGDVTKLLLGDLGFARQVCESAYVISQYEVLHATDLLNRLSAAGFRAVHICDPALQRPPPGRSLVRQSSEPSPTPTRDDADTSLPGLPVMASDHGHPEGSMSRWSSEDFTPDGHQTGMSTVQHRSASVGVGADSRLSSWAETPPIEGTEAEPHDDPFMPRRRHRTASANFGRAGMDIQQPHRVILVPPRLTDSQLKALLHAWCSHDATVGYMIVISTTLPGVETFDWQKFEDMEFTVSSHSAQLIYDLRLLPQCLCLTAGSNQQLQRSRQDFEREANHVGDRVSAVSNSVRVVIEKDVAFHKSKQLQCGLHTIALQVADQLFDRAETVSKHAVEEMCDWQVVEGDWMMAFSYCKSVSRLSLTRSEMSRLANRGRSAAVKYDELYQKLKEEKRMQRKQHAALQTFGGMARVSVRLRRWQKKASNRGPTRTSSLPKSKDGVRQMRRGSLNSQVDLIKVSLANMMDQDGGHSPGDEDGGDSPGSGAATPTVDYQERAQRAQRFGTSRAERAWRATHHVPHPYLPAHRAGPCDAPGGQAAELLNSVRNAVAEGKDEAALKALVDQFAAQRDQVRNSQDPLPIRDAKLLISRVIGQPGEQQLFPNGSSSPAVQRKGSKDMGDRGEKSIFTEKYLKAGRITIFYTTSTYSHDTVLRNCQAVRAKMASARSVRTEYDLGLPINSSVIEALKRYYTSSYTLPQVFFGKDLIGGYEEIFGMSDDELQSFISQFLEQNQTWMEIGWDELKFFGDQLGAGAQGAVRKARWKGNDYAVKVFKTSETTDFEDEVRVLEHLRHPNIVTFYGAVTRNSQHHAIVVELCRGSVYDYLQKFGKEKTPSGSARLNLLTRLRYAHDAAKGLIFLHSRKVIHCDLKTSNLLVANDATTTVKICDFSMSRITSVKVGNRKNGKGMIVPTHPEATGSGTPGFISPEEMMGDVVTTKSDVYSFAMILWELLTSSIPFKEFLYGPGITPGLARLRCIEIFTNDLRPEMPAFMSVQQFFGINVATYGALHDLVQACWQKLADDRPDFEQIAKSLAVIHKKITTATKAEAAVPKPTTQSDHGADKEAHASTSSVPLVPAGTAAGGELASPPTLR